MKIVIVEDNDSLRLSIKNVLEHEGHSVKDFADGRTAYIFLLVEKASIDVAIVDYMLPELDGVSLIAELRSNGVVFPILMLTARDETKDKVLGLESGADYYLTKPFEFDELIATLHALYRRPKSFQAELIDINGAITYDSNKKLLLKGTNEVPLTRAEASILEYLIRHKHEVCSQQSIFEAAFDFAKENWSNTIEVHIKNLRKKLRHKNYDEPIKTIRGLGYTLEIQ